MPDLQPIAQPEPLGLVRVIDGMLQPRIYQLSAGPQGTVIGGVETEGSCITDVAADVSPQHLVIWQQESHWWCQGLDSANGTQLVDGATKAMINVELPRILRQGEPVHPVEVHPGDALCLGLRTRFLVLVVKE